MNIITGNILDITEGIICHQVNCQGVAGAGLAKQIRDKWPGWYKFYKKSSKHAKLGSVDFYMVFSKPKLLVANLYGQRGYGTDRQYTDYLALRNCFVQINIYSENRQVYLPKGIGCGLGGGDWHVVSQLIDEILPDAIVVKLE